MTIFAHKSVQLIINKHWDMRQRAIYGLKLIPYALMLAAFVMWSNLVLSYSHELDHDEYAEKLQLFNDGLLTEEEAGYFTMIVEYRKWDVALCWVLIAFASFFMLTEIQAFWFDPKEYISEWGTNLTDLIPLALLYTNTITSLLEPGTPERSFWMIQSLTSATIWLKFVYFLRTMPYFAYLVRAIRMAFKEIEAFFIILMIICLGIADSFLSFSRSMEAGFLDNYYGAFRYSWLFVLGSNDLIEDADVYADILYFVSSVLVQIVILNVLIGLAS
jgi:hypothetical protein